MPNSKTKLLYFHGGGLITGHKDDYPLIYRNKLDELNYELIGFNYPLAPQTKLESIIEACVDFTLKHNECDYVMMGRSAGAYLVIQVLQELYLRNLKLPNKVILFYGYENFDVPQFRTPRKLKTRIEFSQIENFIHQSSNHDPLYHRALLYLYGRQEGIWPSLLSENSDFLTRSCSVLESDQMPNTFLAHSANDNDVPYLESKKLNQKISNSTLQSVYYHDHEFDNLIHDEQTIKVMTALWSWLAQ